MSVNLPTDASKISSNEIQNDSATKYGSLLKGVNAVNRLRNTWKLIAFKTWKEEDRPDINTLKDLFGGLYTPASGISPIVKTQVQLRCDFPYDLASANITVLIELYVPANTTGFIEINAEWDNGVDTAWSATASYTETDASEHYKLMALTGTVYPRDNTVLASNSLDPKWLNIYTNTWTPDGGVVDIPQFSTLSVMMNPFSVMNPDLNAGGSPFHRDLCVDVPSIGDDFTERGWLEMVDVIQNMVTVLNHSPECSLDLVTNYISGTNNPGYIQNVNDVYRTLGGDWAEVLMPVTEKQMDGNIQVYCSFYLLNGIDMTTVFQSAPHDSNTWTDLETLTGTTGWRQYIASIPVSSYTDFKFRVRIKRTTGTTNASSAMYAFGMRYYYDDILTQRS